MFNRTIVGASAPVFLIDNPADGRLPRQTRIAARTPIILQSASRRASLRILEGCVAVYRELSDERRCLCTLKRSRLIAFDRPEIITILDRQALAALAAGSQSAARMGRTHTEHSVVERGQQ